MTNNSSNQKVYLGIGILSAVILAFLFWWIYGKETATSSGDWVTFLPFLNALLNSITALLLIYGYRLIKQGHRDQHATIMLTATATSGAFLVSYLLYHHFHGDTKFIAQGLIRPVYFFILISHIILSIIQIPCILGTLYFAFTSQLEKHKKIARITFPIWLYVSVTGVLVFIFLQFLNK